MSFIFCWNIKRWRCSLSAGSNHFTWKRVPYRIRPNRRVSTFNLAAHVSPLPKFIFVGPLQSSQLADKPPSNIDKRQRRKNPVSPLQTQGRSWLRRLWSNPAFIDLTAGDLAWITILFLNLVCFIICKQQWDCRKIWFIKGATKSLQDLWEE